MSKKIEKTEFKCPECGEDVYKHLHFHHNVFTNKWLSYWCPTGCTLDCRNCVRPDSHGECGYTGFCLYCSAWTPRNIEGKEITTTN